MFPFDDIILKTIISDCQVAGAKIYCACHPEKALQVEGNSEDYGAAVTISLFRGVLAQLWEVQNV